MKKIENNDKEVRSYFKRQIKEYLKKCKKNAMTDLQKMKKRNDPRIKKFGEDAIFELLYNNRLFNTDIAAFVYNDDDTMQLYIGWKGEPSGDCYRITNWQSFSDKSKMIDAFVESIIAGFNAEVDYREEMFN